MNRTIKFRGKRKDNGEWLIGGYYFECWGCSYIAWGIDNDCASIIEVLHETVGQYTGLKDKNGVEIYEGDILKNNFCEFYKIIWHDELASFLVESPTCLVGNPIERFLIKDRGSSKNYEVIGNIHDNPDLLEEK